MANKKIAFSYIRMSTKEQLAGDSRRRQLEKSREYADKHGYDFRDTVEDIGVSAYRGKNFTDGELGKFIQAAKDNEFDPDNVVLLIESFDRFSRDDPFSAVAELVKFIDTGVTVETTIDGQQYSKKTMGKQQHLLYTAVGVLFRAHEESATKSKRLKESWEEKRKSITQKPYTGRTPAWLELNKKSGEINILDAPSRIIKKVFDLSIDENMGASSIARYLNDNIEQYPKFTKPEKRNRNKTRGVKPGWHESYIKKILNNKAVYGFFQPHRMVDGKQVEAGPAILDYYPAIIDKERFDLAQAMIQERKVSGSGRKGEKFSNIFTRLIECGSCGGNIRYLDKGKPPKGGQYLICHNSFTNNGCKAPLWRYCDFEKEFIKEVVEIPLDELMVNDNDPHTRATLLNEITVLRQRVTDIEIDHKTVRDQLRKAKRENQSLSVKGYEDDLQELDDDYKNTQSELGLKESELASLESRLKKRTQSELIELYSEMKSINDDDELVSLRRKINALIRNVVQRIVIKNDFNNVPVWETLDTNLPKSFIQSLHDKGYKTNTDIESFFNTDYGRRLFNEALREIKIYFKGGGVRVCKPAIKKSYRLQRRLRTFIDNDKKRTSEQLRKEKQRGYKKQSKVQFNLGKEIHETLTELEEQDMFDELQDYMDSLSERQLDALSYYNETSSETDSSD